MQRGARVVLRALVAYIGMGLVYGVVLILTTTRSNYHWLGILMTAVLWWPWLQFGTILYFLSHP